MSKCLRRWHRYVGLSLAGVALVLAVTGMLLNHSADLSLDKRYINWSPLLDWYDFPVLKVDNAFQIDAQHWLIHLKLLVLTVLKLLITSKSVES